MATNRAARGSHRQCAKAVLDGLPQAMWFIRRQMRRHRTHRLSVPQFRTLVLLDRYPSASLSAVAEHLGSALPTASRMVAGLVGKRLVERTASPDDNRQMSLTLTNKGRTALDAARQATLESLAQELSSLSESDCGAISNAMALLHQVFASTPKPGEEVDE